PAVALALGAAGGRGCAQSAGAKSAAKSAMRAQTKRRGSGAVRGMDGLALPAIRAAVDTSLASAGRWTNNVHARGDFDGHRKQAVSKALRWSNNVLSRSVFRGKRRGVGVCSRLIDAGNNDSERRRSAGWESPEPAFISNRRTHGEHL